MTREEILKLSEKTEENQWSALYAEGILKEVKRLSLVSEKYVMVVESLADCAERLWREAVSNPEFDNAICTIGKLLKPDAFMVPGGFNSYSIVVYEFESIHRIQACLLAKEGK